MALGKYSSVPAVRQNTLEQGTSPEASALRFTICSDVMTIRIAVWDTGIPPISLHLNAVLFQNGLHPGHGGFRGGVF